MRNVNLMVALLTASVSMGCGAAEEPLDEEFEQLEQALNSSNACRDAAPNVTVDETWAPGFTTPSSYGSGSCNDGYFVDINDYELQFVGGFAYRLRIGPNFTLTSSNCEKSRIMVYLWRNNGGGSWTYLGSKSSWGNWNGSSCGIAVHPEVEFAMPDGNDYHFAVSARLYNTAGDAGSGYTTKSIRFSML